MLNHSPFSLFLKRNWRICLAGVLLVLMVVLPFFANWNEARHYFFDNQAVTKSTTITTRQMPPAVAPVPPSATVSGKKATAASVAPAAPVVTREETTKTEIAFRQPIWLTLAQPVLGATAALVALWSFVVRLKQEREQFDRKEQEDRFKDIQDRFANADAKTRANAALRLAEMARFPKPGAAGNPICEENNPFFLRAAAPLAIALHMEENASVRAANVKALKNMVAFVQGKEKGELLLHVLIKDLYEANLTAKRAFIKSLAAFCPDKNAVSESNFKKLIAAVRFTNDEVAAKATLLSLMEEDDFKTDCETQVKENGSVPVSPLTAVKQDAARLMDTRDALAVALCALSRSLYGIILNNAFLTGAELNGAELYRAQLNRAQLYRAQLNGAWLNGAQLYGVVVEARNGTLPANFTGSTWHEANFHDADGNKDERLWEWLVQRYGTDEQKAELAAQKGAGTASPPATTATTAPSGATTAVQQQVGGNP